MTPLEAAAREARDAVEQAELPDDAEIAELRDKAVDMLTDLIDACISLRHPEWSQS